jgi:long-chain acyl-CoA synthetase
VSVYTDRPWLSLYRDGAPPDIEQEHATMLELFRATVARDSAAVAIRYFDTDLTFGELDERSDALAAALVDHGFAAGDRLAVYVQNNPAFVLGLLGAWKAGGSAVAINPMNKARELTYLLADSGATALLCLDDLWRDVGKGVVASGEADEVRVSTVITLSALDDQGRDDERLFSGVERVRDEETLDLTQLLEEYAGRTPQDRPVQGEDVAILTYTSGTTGVPKGAMNTHANIAFNSQVYRDWMDLGPDDSILGVAPLFHITGLVGHIGVALLVGCPLVIAHRFEPNVVLDAIKEHRPTFTIGSITVFIALAGLEDSTPETWSSFSTLYSGGAPIAPAVTEQFQQKTGLYIHNIYGLTETNSPSHAVPMGVKAPVDSSSGALSVGVPVFNTVVRILDEEGKEAPVGEIGEICTSGPQVVSGYWNKPEATAESIPGGELHTGDVGFMDEQGWFYLVDRKKDMINAAGYKVWPREVEDVLYGHPAVREVAVVGVPDEYRGETVKAYVSVKPGQEISEEDLIAWSKELLAAYKYPRSIEFVDELPKTTTGKILRRELRDQNA